MNEQGDANFWAYTLAKQQWWSFLTNAAYIEIADTCIPGASDDVYVMAYICGIFFNVAVNLLCFAAGVGGNQITNQLVVGAPIITSSICFGYWYFCRANSQKFAKMFEFVRDSNKHHLYDMFNMVQGLGLGEVPRLGKEQCTVESDNHIRWWNTFNKLQLLHSTRKNMSLDAVSSPIHLDTSPVLVDRKERGGAESAKVNRTGSENLNSVGEASISESELESASALPMELSYCDEDVPIVPETLLQYLVVKITELCVIYKVLPRYWNTQSVPWAGVTTEHRNWHFFYTFAFLAGWIVCYFSLMVSKVDRLHIVYTFCTIVLFSRLSEFSQTGSIPMVCSILHGICDSESCYEEIRASY